MISGGTEFLFFSIIFAVVMCVWAVYEWRQFRARHNRYVLPAPRMDRIARGGKDAWVVGEARDRC